MGNCLSLSPTWKPSTHLRDRLDPGVGGASGQMLALTGQNENALAGQYSQPLLMPPPTLPSLSLPRQAVSVHDGGMGCTISLKYYYL